MKHHPFGPSSLPRRSKCPASLIIEESIPEQELNDSAITGIIIHAAVDEYIKTGKTPELEDINMQLKADDCIAFLEKYKENNAIKSVTGEITLFANDPMGEIFMGTADVLMLSDDGFIHILDWKTGYYKVDDAEDNLQGKAYALAAMQSFSKEKCKVTFYNPTLHDVSSAEFLDQRKLVQEIQTVIAHCLEESPDCIPGESQCRYCKGAITGVCNAWRKWIGLGLTVDQEETPQGMSDEELVLQYESCIRTEKYLEILRNEISRRFTEHQKDVCGYVLKSKPGARVVTDVQKCFDNLGGAIPLPEFLKCVKVNISQLEKAYLQSLKMSHPGETIKAADAKRQLESLICDIISRSETATLSRQ